jgi:hypothetical protein
MDAPQAPSRTRGAQLDSALKSVSFFSNRYLPVRNIIPESVLDYLKQYCKIKLDNQEFFKDEQCPSSLSLAGDPALDALLEWLRPEISRLVGLDLTPTFSYARIYAQDEVLVRHTDRPACEIGLTVALEVPEGAPPSVLCLSPPGLPDASIEMAEGDGCLYAGTEVAHWRDAFPCDGYVQVFFFFINTHGRYFPDYAYDGRRHLGASKEHLAACALTVGERGISVRLALRHLKALLDRQPDLSDDLIGNSLIEAAIESASPVQVSDAEVDQAVNQFRIDHGLYTGDTTQTWLDDNGLTMSRLHELMTDRLRTRKFRDGIVAQRSKPRFDEHRRDFDALTLLLANAPSHAVARALTKEANRAGLWTALSSGDARFAALPVTRKTGYRRDLPNLGDDAVGAITSVQNAEGGYWVGEVLACKAALFDRATRARIEAILFAEWLATQRRSILVQWHLS